MRGQPSIKICSETSAYKIQTPGNYPEESIQHSEQGESFEIKKSSLIAVTLNMTWDELWTLNSIIRKHREYFSV